MARSYLSAADRKAQVLERAGRLFATKGFDATTVDDICVAVGLTPGGLYRHFRGKREIVLALIATDAAETSNRVESASRSASGASATLRAVLTAQLDPLRDRDVAMLRAEILAQAARDPEVADATREHDRRVALLGRDALQAAASPGSPAAIDLEAAVELLAVIVDGIAVRCAVEGAFHDDWLALALAVSGSLVGEDR